MKNFYLFLTLLTLLFSCNKRDINRNTYDISYLNDTTYIHNILRKVKNNKSGNSDSTRQYLETAIARCEKTGYSSGKSEALYLLASLLYDQNKYNEALELYNQSLAIAEKQNNLLLKARCLERKASVNLTTGDDHKALKLYYEALPLFEQTHNKEGIAKVYNIIGLYKNSQKSYDTAEMYLKKAIALNTESGNTKGLVHNNGNLGYVYEKSGQFEKAEQLYRTAVALSEKAGDSINLPMLLSNLASLNLKMNNKSMAFSLLRQSVGIAEKTRNTSMLALLFADIGELYLDDQRNDSAAILLNRSVSCAKSIGDVRTQLHATRLLLRSDTLRNDFREASARFNSISILNDTVYARKLRHSLRASELQYENQKKSQLIELQSIDIISTSKQKRLYLILFLLSAVSLILLVLVIVLKIRDNRRKHELFEENLRIKDLQLENSAKADEINKLKINKIEEEIRVKEREQVSSALALEQKNELLNLISGKISESMHDTGSLNVSALNEVVTSIKSQIKDSTESDLFNQKFNKLHSDFYIKLKEKHPELTKSELKFCAYLKLNLNGNQIASIMSVTPEAIRKTRYRIRKKLNILRSESLENYISTF